MAPPPPLKPSPNFCPPTFPVWGAQYGKFPYLPQWPLYWQSSRCATIISEVALTLFFLSPPIPPQIYPVPLCWLGCSCVTHDVTSELPPHSMNIWLQPRLPGTCKECTQLCCHKRKEWQLVGVRKGSLLSREKLSGHRIKRFLQEILCALEPLGGTIEWAIHQEIKRTMWGAQEAITYLVSEMIAVNGQPSSLMEDTAIHQMQYQSC